MDKIEKSTSLNKGEESIGLIFRKLESLENFFPCYKTLIKKNKI